MTFRTQVFWGNVSSTATAVILTGPTFGTIGVASTYTVQLDVPVISGTVTVTPAADNLGGVSPPSVALTAAAPSNTFTCTPSAAGTTHVSITNDRGLNNTGSPISLVASAALTPVRPRTVALQPVLAQ